MASLEITAEELSTIDTNQVAQMTLKDGTVIVVNGGAEAQEAQADRHLADRVREPARCVACESVHLPGGDNMRVHTAHGGARLHVRRMGAGWNLGRPHGRDQRSRHMDGQYLHARLPRERRLRHDGRDPLHVR